MAVERLSGGLPIRRDPVEFDERGPLEWEDDPVEYPPRSTLAWSTMLVAVAAGLVVWCILGAAVLWLAL